MAGHTDFLLMYFANHNGMARDTFQNQLKYFTQ